MLTSGVVQLDAAGRLVVPKPLREAAGVRAGQPLCISCAEDGALVIRPLATGPSLVRRGRWLVVEAPPGAEPLTEQDVARTFQELREPAIRD